MRISDRSCFYVTLVMLCLFISGCGDTRTDEEKLSDTKAAVEKSLDTLQQQRATISEKVAIKQLENAEDAMAELKPIVEKNKDPQLPGLSENLNKKLYKIRQLELEIVCQRRYADLSKSYKVKAYHLGRNGLFKYSIKSMAFAARQASDSPVDLKTNKELLNMLDSTREFIGMIIDIPLKPDGEPDWKKVAEKLDEMSDKTPAELNLILAFGHLASGHNKLALAELDMCKTENFSDTKQLSLQDKILVYHVLKTFAFHKMSWAPLADKEFSELEKHMLNNKDRYGDVTSKNELLTGWHLYQAYVNLFEKRDLMKADEHISWLIRLNPNSDSMIYITGEKIGENGQIEKVEKCSLNDLKEDRYKEIIRILGTRVSAIRDSKPLEPPPAITADPVFVIKLVYAYACAYSEESNAAEKCRSFLAAAEKFSRYGQDAADGRDSSDPGDHLQ